MSTPEQTVKEKTVKEQTEQSPNEGAPTPTATLPPASDDSVEFVFVDNPPMIPLPLTVSPTHRRPLLESIDALATALKSDSRFTTAGDEPTSTEVVGTELKKRIRSSIQKMKEELIDLLQHKKIPSRNYSEFLVELITIEANIEKNPLFSGQKSRDVRKRINEFLRHQHSNLNPIEPSTTLPPTPGVRTADPLQRAKEIIKNLTERVENFYWNDHLTLDEYMAIYGKLAEIKASLATDLKQASERLEIVAGNIAEIMQSKKLSSEGPSTVSEGPTFSRARSKEEDDLNQAIALSLENTSMKDTRPIPKTTPNTLSSNDTALNTVVIDRGEKTNALIKSIKNDPAYIKITDPIEKKSFEQSLIKEVLECMKMGTLYNKDKNPIASLVYAASIHYDKEYEKVLAERQRQQIAKEEAERRAEEARKRKEEEDRKSVISLEALKDKMSRKPAPAQKPEKPLGQPPIDDIYDNDLEFAIQLSLATATLGTAFDSGSTSSASISSSISSASIRSTSSASKSSSSSSSSTSTSKNKAVDEEVERLNIMRSLDVDLELQHKLLEASNINMQLSKRK